MFIRTFARECDVELARGQKSPILLGKNYGYKGHQRFY